MEPIPNHEIDDFQVHEYTRVYDFLRVLTQILRIGTVPIYFLAVRTRMDGVVGQKYEECPGFTIIFSEAVTTTRDQRTWR